jgi:hypothetical protein
MSRTHRHPPRNKEPTLRALPLHPCRGKPTAAQLIASVAEQAEPPEEDEALGNDFDEWLFDRAYLDFNWLEDFVPPEDSPGDFVCICHNAAQQAVCGNRHCPASAAFKELSL